MNKFKLVSNYKPAGDQSEAIKQLVNGINSGDKFQTLLGVTGSGKTFTISNVIEQINKPTLIISHNKTLAAQLYLDSGVRSMERGIVSAGRDPESGDHRYPSLELTRLTIPRRVYTQAHMDVVAESVKAIYDVRHKTKGLKMVYEPEYLRFFQARFEVL